MSTAPREEKQRKFLRAYSTGSSISKAALFAHVDRKTIYNWKESDPEFARLFQEAYNSGDDVIDDEIKRRGVDGYTVPMVSMGKVVYDSKGKPLMETRYSDSLLSLLAKSRMKKYRDKQELEISGDLTIRTQWGSGTLDEDEERRNEKRL